MATIFPGRYTAQTDESFVVFLIGMRINQFLDVPSWTRVARAMPRMLNELRHTPDIGLLHAEFFLYWPGVTVVQYWRSFDHLHAYAHARDAAHLPAWAEFNRLTRDAGSVGIWHETYAVEPGSYEAIYANMPKFGLACAARHLRAIGRFDAARTRMGRVAVH